MSQHPTSPGMYWLKPYKLIPRIKVKVAKENLHDNNLIVRFGFVTIDLNKVSTSAIWEQISTSNNLDGHFSPNK